MKFNSETAAAAGQASSRAGIPNKFTKDFKDRVMTLLDSNWNLVVDDMKKLSPKDRVDTFIKLLDFALPKLSRTEHRDITEIDDLLRLSPDERKDQIKKLRARL